MHLLIQNYLKDIYYAGKDDKYDFKKQLMNLMCNQYQNQKKERNGGIDFVSQDQLLELYYQGIEIFQEIYGNPTKYFPYRNHQLIGVQIPLLYDIAGDITFKGYIDIVIKNKRQNTYKIYDIKTSYKGWKKQKQDQNKKLQLSLYKKYYSQMFNVDISKIEIEFFIIKRNVFAPPNLNIDISRVQRFAPASGTITIKKHMKILNNFLEYCYPNNVLADVSYYQSDKFIPTPKLSDCKYCPFSKKICGKGRLYEKRQEQQV